MRSRESGTVSADRNGLNVDYLSGACGIYSQNSGVAAYSRWLLRIAWGVF
jgi:hypothetical protein